MRALPARANPRTMFGSAPAPLTALMSAIRVAVSRVTRLPLPKAANDPAEFRAAARWMPLLGALTGLAHAGLVLLLGQVMPTAAAVAVVLALEALVTGARAEAGLGETVGAVARGDADRRIVHHGAGGAGSIAVGAVWLLRFVATVTLYAGAVDTWRFTRLTFEQALDPSLVLIAAGAAAQLTSVALMVALEPLPTDGGATRGRKYDRDVMLFGGAWTLPALFGFLVATIGGTVVVVVLGTLGYVWGVGFLERHFGGTNEHANGAGACLGRLVVLLGAMVFLCR